MEKFKSGHEIFDEISSFPVGSFILVLDKTHFESSIFLNALFSNKNQKRQICLLAPYSIESPFKTIKLDLQKMSLQEISITINKLREDLKGGIIIHNYLPHVLVKENEDSVLKMIESWCGKAIEKETTEFFTLPKETFSVFEKKFNSLVHGSIEIIIKKKESIQQFFSISRACKPEYHMREFQYIIKDNKLLIKWGDEFIDTLPKEEELIIKEKINYLKSNIYCLRLLPGPFESYNLSFYEQLLLSQMIGKRLDDVQTLFPEIFEELLNKIAIWNIRGIIKLEKVEKREPKSFKKLKLITRIAFSLPEEFCIRMLYGRPSSVPAECYLALKKAADSFAEILGRIVKTTSFNIKLEDIEDFFQEMAGRITSIDHIKKAGEDPQAIKLDISYLPKMVTLSLFYGWGLKPRIEKSKDVPNTYFVHVDKCFLCKGIESKKPVCRILSSIIVGMCAIVFKEKFSCEEIKCKAMGDNSCVFLLKKL